MNTPRKRKSAALVLIDVSNLAYMRQNFSQDIVEQTLLRAVIKIKRIFGDMDAIGRIGDNRLAVLMEGADRERVGKLAVELIASGLMPSKNLQQDITIIFHFGVVILEDYEGHLDEILPSLQILCDKMSPRTQRPIRFLNDTNTTKKHTHPTPQANSADLDVPSSLLSQQQAEEGASSMRMEPGNHSTTNPLHLPPSRPSNHSSGHNSAGHAPSSSFHR
jgi:hypothetical protein